MVHLEPGTDIGIEGAASFDNTPETKVFWTQTKKRVAAGTVAGSIIVPSVVVANNTDEIERFHLMHEDNNEWVAPFDNCPGIEQVVEDASGGEAQLDPEFLAKLEAKQAIQTEYKEVTSAADDLDLFEYLKRVSGTASEFINQSIDYTLAPETRFKEENTGIEFVTYAPRTATVNQEAFSELYTAPLKVNPEIFEHPKVRQLMECYQQKILTDREFSDKVYRVYVAPYGGWCIEDGRYQLKSEVLKSKGPDDPKKCDGTGFTPPHVDIDILGVPVAEYRIMMLSTPSTGQEMNQGLARNFLHESLHSYASLVEKTPFMINPDERLTSYMVNVILHELYPDGKQLPEPIVYDQPVVGITP